MRRTITPLLALALLLFLPAAGLSAGTPPRTTTGSPSAVSDTGATLSGTVDTAGQATSYDFQYGTSAAYGQQTAAQTLPPRSGPQAVGAQLSGLTPGTTFHYRLVATNAAGATAGQDQTFTTAGSAPAPSSAPRPAAATGPAARPQSNSVVLTGAVTSTGEDVRWYFEYGTTALYGSQSSARIAVKTPPGGRAVSATLAGLQAGQEYHYRLVAVNSAGLATGVDRTFFTTALARRVPLRLTLHTRETGGATGPLRLLMNGRLTPPKDVARTRACTGLVSLEVKRGTSTISVRRARLRRDCTYSSSVTFTDRSRARGHLRVFAHFLGNAALGFSTTGPAAAG